MLTRSAIETTLEEDLILLCSRLELSPSQELQLETLLETKTLSWREVLYKAEWHRLSALLFLHLRRLNSENVVPPKVMQILESVYLKNAAQNLYFRSELRKVLSALENEGIPVIVLKGHALLGTVFVNAALRPTTDIDLLVREDSADKAQAIVCQYGYSPRGSPAVQEKQRRDHHHLPRLVGQDGMGAFEIHSHVVSRDSPLRFNIAGFLERARQSSFWGAKAQVLVPEDMLIHLAIHFFLDRRFRSYAALGQICDIAEVIRYYQAEIDWSVLEGEVLAGGLRGPVYCGLSLAATLLEAPVPEGVLQRLKPPRFNPTAADRFLKRRVLDTRKVVASELVTPGSEYSLIRLGKGGLSRLFPSPSYLAERYGDPAVSPVPLRLYLRRLIEVARILATYHRTPSALLQQVLVDRWIHSLQTEAHGHSD